MQIMDTNFGLGVHYQWIYKCLKVGMFSFHYVCSRVKANHLDQHASSSRNKMFDIYTDWWMLYCYTQDMCYYCNQYNSKYLLHYNTLEDTCDSIVILILYYINIHICFISVTTKIRYRISLVTNNLIVSLSFSHWFLIVS